MNLELKQLIFQACIAQLDEKIGVYLRAIAAAEEAAANETKSSVGDKYETGRAMMHLEKEKNDAQLQQVLLTKSRLQQIRYRKQFETVEVGALVQTNIGNLFFLESVGKVMLEGKKFQVISIQSPIGKILRGASAGESKIFNGKEIKVLELT